MSLLAYLLMPFFPSPHDWFTPTKMVYVESFARVRDLSLTGKLVYLWVHEFVVQWPQLLASYPGARYLGKLM